MASYSSEIHYISSKDNPSVVLKATLKSEQAVLAGHSFSKRGEGWVKTFLTTKTAQNSARGLSHGIKIEQVLSTIIILISDVKTTQAQAITKFHAQIASAQKKNRVKDAI